MKLAAFIIGILAIEYSGVAYPTIPTADLLEPGYMRIEFENDGYSRLFAL